MLQIADNIARSGQDVIIFTLEQSKFELVTKAISRISYQEQPGRAISHSKILAETDANNIFNENDIFMNASTKYYEQIAPRTIIEEGNFNTSVDTIKDYIQRYIAVTGKQPVVFIDYLQILAPSNEKFTDKQQTDYNATTLKKISRDYNIPIFAISSFNRANYSQEAGYEAFKESGSIEYTADVLFTMQLSYIGDLKPGETADRRQVQEEKRKLPRQIELICLKNRNGRSNFKIKYDYNPVFNNFKEKDEREQDL